ncbi:MAG: Flp pilus assembly protein CpaB [Chloroflexi bacterium]|nr:Flp pilus assembly protein CpaB [Chloroflexota bacterium]
MSGKRSGFTLITLGVILALTVGAVTFFLTQRAAQAEMPTSDVLVAVQEIPERSIIPASAIGSKKMPVEFIPAGALTRPEEAIGRMTPTKIYVGETVLVSKLVDTKGQAGLSFVIEKGKVMITFPSSNIVGLGIAKPGDTVDVVVTYRPGKGKTPAQGQGIAELLTPNVTQFTMQSLKIVTIGASSTPSQAQQSQPNFITFAVDPEDALFLKAMKDSEDLVIELVLRAAGDDRVFRTEPVTIKSILDRYGVRAP